MSYLTLDTVNNLLLVSFSRFPYFIILKKDFFLHYLAYLNKNLLKNTIQYHFFEVAFFFVLSKSNFIKRAGLEVGLGVALGERRGVGLRGNITNFSLIYLN